MAILNLWSTSKLLLWPSWSYGRWIYNYLCNQCLSQITLWVRIPIRRGVLDKTLCDEVCQWPATGRWFLSIPVASTNKTEILLKIALNATNQTKPNRVMDLYSKVMKRLDIYVAIKLCYLSIELLCFHYFKHILLFNKKQLVRTQDSQLRNVFSNTYMN